MKGHLEALIQNSPSPIHSRNIVREYLQARVLSVLQKEGAFIPLAFQGGTALRFLYGLPRHSEDLDFALEGAADAYDFEEYATASGRVLSKEGYHVAPKLSMGGVVHNCFLRFRGLLFDLGLSPHQDEVLSIKLEVDTRPPKGAGLNITTVRKHVLLRIQHHDRASLLAGKIHALLQRQYTKGRDIYDLIWYLGDREWPSPNLGLLNNALQQTGWGGPTVTNDGWKRLLSDHLKKLDWRAVRADVSPFLEHPEEVDLLDNDTVLALLE